MTWGKFYWPVFMLAVSLAFAGPEIYALFTNQANTLSDYSWDELNIHGRFPIHTLAWNISLIVWLLFVIVITMHIWWRGV
jgi:hypothetical protein